MKVWKIFLFTLLGLFFAGCLESSPNTTSEKVDDPTYSNNTDPTLEGMMFIFAENSETILGTQDSTTRAKKERAIFV